MLRQVVEAVASEVLEVRGGTLHRYSRFRSCASEVVEVLAFQY